MEKQNRYNNSIHNSIHNSICEYGVFSFTENSPYIFYLRDILNLGLRIEKFYFYNHTIIIVSVNHFLLN